MDAADKAPPLRRRFASALERNVPVVNRHRAAPIHIWIDGIQSVILTHANLLANMRAIAKRCSSSGDVGVSWLPLYHDMGLIARGSHCCITVAGAVMSPLAFLHGPKNGCGRFTNIADDRSGAQLRIRMCVRKIADRILRADLSSGVRAERREPVNSRNS